MIAAQTKVHASLKTGLLALTHFDMRDNLVAQVHLPLKPGYRALVSGAMKI
jgi:hypothetical protein